jgi:CRISPR-associated protein Csm1
LIKIVQRADSYSCAERDVEQQRRREIELRKVPLDSIFSNVNLEIKEPYGDENLRYHLQSLHPLSSFPESFKALSDNEIQELIDKFKRSIPKFSDLKNFDDALNIWLNFLEKYTWAVPSDTRYETSDVSLYDHLRSSAAIAACLYKRHIVAIEKGKNFDRLNEFVFIGGDFSGIQDYIFDITNRGSGGASKRLRARSFFISLFSEVTIHKILHALGLPLVCNLFSAGGKFLLLGPNVTGIEARNK